MFGLGHWELLIILVIALLLFGRRLPDVGRSIGKGIVEFKKGLKGISDEIETESARPDPASTERAYRAPLAEGGEDRRVRRDEVVDEPKPAQNS